jgi:F-type H+-transporting ATPase subunit b
MATQAHTEVPGGGHPKFPPFNTETFPSQLLWLVVSFIALYIIIARLAIPRIGGIVDARTARIDGDIGEANRLKQQSDVALASYEKSLADARARAQQLAGEMRDKLNAEAEQARTALEAKLNAKLSEAEKTIDATKSAAMANVRGIAIETAAAIVQRLTGTAPAGGAVEAAVADVLKQ